MVNFRTLAVALALRALSLPLAAAEPTLTVVEPLVARSIDGKRPLVFDVWATGGTLYSLTVDATSLKDPDTKPLNAAGSLDIALSGTTVGPNPVRVTITPRDGALTRIGDYALALRIGASTAKKNGKPVQLPVAATLTRVKPDVGIVALKDNAIRIERAWPWERATLADVPVTIQNKMSETAPGITVSADPVTTTGDAPEIIDGTVTVSPSDPTTTAFPVDVKDGVAQLKLKVDVADAGVMQSRLRVSAAGQQPIEEVPFRIVVSDDPGLPLVVIFLGVLAAFGLNYAANRLRPERENRLRALQLQERLTRLRLRTSDHLAEVDRINATLHDLTLANTAGLTADVKTKLDTIANEIEAVEKKNDDERVAAEKKLREVRAAIEALRGQASEEDVGRLVAKVESIRVSIEAYRYDESVKALDAVRSEADALAPAPKHRARPGDELDAAVAADAGPSVQVVTPPKSRRAGNQIVFEARGNVASNAQVEWDFGDGKAATAGPRMKHRYDWSNVYEVTATLPDGTIASGTVEVAPSATERDVRDEAKRLRNLDLLLSGIALVVATATGVWALYTGKVFFGTLAQYIEAFVWGFGVDSSVRGFANVVKKLSSNE